MNKKKLILIMGLPGSGKTTLADRLKSEINAHRLNADVIRSKFNDWDFSKNGRIRQAKRMFKFAKELLKKKNVIVDFICPTPDSFKYFKADFIVWMDTVKKSRFSNIDKIFKKPKKYNLRVTSKDVELWQLIFKDKFYNNSYSWDNKKPTVQMLGRFQPWHLGHRKLFEMSLRKAGQVNIQVKDVYGLNDNPYTFNEIKKKISRDLKVFGKRLRITKAPNITEIVYGRKVGYKISRIKLSNSLHKISATNIRKNMRKKGLLKTTIKNNE